MPTAAAGPAFGGLAAVIRVVVRISPARLRLVRTAATMGSLEKIVKLACKPKAAPPKSKVCVECRPPYTRGR
jgi:hypothetical protein